MRPQLPHCAIQAGDTAVPARPHHAALQRRRRELGEFAAFEPFGHPQVCVKQTLFHRSTRLCNGLWRHGHEALLTQSTGASAADALTLIAD